ncbi:MAG: DUF1559 domain-containing protein, partial [Planctomycetaceae bacterium]|nr:DUF1559 domain-containing protein [Planctomycetaceae bacterium]
AVQQAREAARRTQCKNNLKQIGLALHNYHDVARMFPPASIYTYPNWHPPGTQASNYSWIMMILPYFDQAPLYNSIDTTRPLWGQQLNGQEIASTLISGLICPSDSGYGRGNRHGIGWTNYAASEGYDWHRRDGHRINGLFEIMTPLAIKDVTDGTSNTIAVGEVTAHGYQSGPIRTAASGTPRRGNAGVFRSALMATHSNHDLNIQPILAPDGTPWTTGSGWWRSSPYAFQPTFIAAYGMNSNWPGPSSPHIGGIQVLLADGSVRFLSENLDMG